jgi:hypothetical protein
MQDASKPIWIKQPDSSAVPKIQQEIRICVATPVHSNVSIFYTQALLKFQQECFQQNILVSFVLLKSSLVTQGRNLCVSNFLEDANNYTHLLFIDSDIDFNSESVFTMLKKDKDIIAIPYPMKDINWDRIISKWKVSPPTDAFKLSTTGYTFPIRLEDSEHIKIDDGVMEVSHAPTGCMLIKRSTILKMMEHYPDLKINQPTIINGKEIEKPHFYNLFDTLHDPVTKKFFGEDFGFCQRWTDMGGKCYVYVMDYISHIGDYVYTGRFWDDLQRLKKIDDEPKI